jgi:hypothetical protein
MRDSTSFGAAALSRRAALARVLGGLGATAFSCLIERERLVAAAAPTSHVGPHFAARAKRIIYLFQSGAPSQLDLFDYKPGLARRHGENLPESIRRGQRLTVMTSRQERFPVASSEAINHDPAITFLQTGAQTAGRPSIGAWLAYGLGSESDQLPAFVAMVSQGSAQAGQPLYERLWGSGFLPTRYQGVKFRGAGDPVLYLSDPEGLDRASRRRILDDLRALNELRLRRVGDAEIATRIEQYEMAFRMQASVPELTNVSDEPESVFERYGAEARKPGTYAANCLLARRLAERGVRFVQLFHRGWDQHTNLRHGIELQCRDTDRASAALVQDLQERGLLDDTLVVWGGEFGRTVYSQGPLTLEEHGRDHHPRCFTVWLAGGGVRPGLTYGETDDYGYNVIREPVSVHDLHATMLHQLGLDHTRLTFQYQGRDHRLTDVAGEVVRPILA